MLPSHTRTFRACLAALAVAALVGSVRADITGKVTLEGKPPKVKQINMAGCAANHLTPVDEETVIVGAKGELKNVVVSLKLDDPKDVPPPPATKVVLDQKGCMYEPHVSAMQVGQQLVAENSDPFLHNVHGQGADGYEFNLAQPNVNPGQAVTPQPKEAQEISVKCDVHNWMQAWVLVFEHPYFAVTDDKGEYKIDTKGLKDGEYTVQMWHEKYGKQDVEHVTVKDGKATVDGAFDAKKVPKAKKKP